MRGPHLDGPGPVRNGTGGRACALNAVPLARMAAQSGLRRRRRPADPGWVSRAKRRQWRESDFAEGKKVLPECRRA